MDRSLEQRARATLVGARGFVELAVRAVLCGIGGAILVFKRLAHLDFVLREASGIGAHELLLSAGELQDGKCEKDAALECTFQDSATREC